MCTLCEGTYEFVYVVVTFVCTYVVSVVSGCYVLLLFFSSVPPAPGAPPLNDTALQSIHVSLLSVVGV